MKLLAIEIDLDTFFDVNLIVFTTISFVFSVVIIAFLVIALRPLSSRASIALGRIPEKLSITYIRLLIYGFAQFIAFIADVFLVIFGNEYTKPWFTTAVFLILLLYKLIFVLFKAFKDLGYNSKGIVSTLKTASKIAKDKNFESLSETLEVPMEKTNDNVKKKTKIRYKKNTIGRKLPYVFLLILMTFSCRMNHFAYAPTKIESPEKAQLLATLKIPQEEVFEMEETLKVKWKGEWIDMKIKVIGKDIKITKY